MIEHGQLHAAGDVDADGVRDDGVLGRQHAADRQAVAHVGVRHQRARNRDGQVDRVPHLLLRGVVEIGAEARPRRRRLTRHERRAHGALIDDRGGDHAELHVLRVRLRVGDHLAEHLQRRLGPELALELAADGQRDTNRRPRLEAESDQLAALDRRRGLQAALARACLCVLFLASDLSVPISLVEPGILLTATPGRMGRKGDPAERQIPVTSREAGRCCVVTRRLGVRRDCGGIAHPRRSCSRAAALFPCSSIVARGRQHPGRAVRPTRRMSSDLRSLRRPRTLRDARVQRRVRTARHPRLVGPGRSVARLEAAQGGAASGSSAHGLRGVPYANRPDAALRPAPSGEERRRLRGRRDLRDRHQAAETVPRLPADQPDPRRDRHPALMGTRPSGE